MSYKIPEEQTYITAFGYAANSITKRAKIGLNGNLFYSNLPVIAPEALKEASVKGYENIESYEEQEAIAYAETGEPFFDLITFSHPDLPGDELDMTMLYMVELSRKKQQSVTIVNENEEGGEPQGEVIESYGWLPWEMRLKGILVDMENHHYPIEQVRSLYQLTNIHESIEVYSDFINSLGINYVNFIAAPDINRSAQFIDSQPFTLYAKSHAPITALIID